MKPFKRTIFDLFDAKRRYIVPLFQRQYVWTREKQWEPLWEDILSVAERRLENRNWPAHFLGAIVLEQIKTFGNQVPAHLIIDGQQRLITFQLILASLRETANEVGAYDYRDEIQRYLRNTGIMENPYEEKYKVWPSKADQEAFKTIIDNVSTSEQERDSKTDGGLITQAYTFFRNAINEYVKTGKDELMIENLYHVLRHDLEIVSIELEDEDDPQIIFETLNARGEPLLPSDLLRNFIFWRAGKMKEQKEFLYNKYWHTFENKFWKTEERLGRLNRPRIDIFMQHFLQSQSGEDVNIGRLFHEYKTWINEKKPFNNVEEELVCLTKYASRFKQILESKYEDIPYGRFFWRLKNIDVGTIYPLLLYSLNHQDADQQTIIAMFSDLESYLIRRMICGLTTKNYNKIFLQLIREIMKKGFSRDNLKDYLLSLTGDASKWPNDSEFADAWMNRRSYLEIKPVQKIIVVLRAIEDALKNEKNEKMVILSKLTVEHIMPQSWHKAWPLSDGSYAKDRISRILAGEHCPEADERDSLLHTFGNLTLLTHPLNVAVSNSRWREKKEEIVKQSALRLNRDLQEYEDWGPKEIKERGMKLLKKALEIWPYPKS